MRLLHNYPVFGTHGKLLRCHDSGNEGIQMLRYLLPIALAIPIQGYCQRYADTPFYRPVSGVPSTARVEGWAHGSITANGVVIDLSISPYKSSSDSGEFSGSIVNSWVDKKDSAHVFHYYLQYDRLNVVFGYDLRVEPISGTDEIKCTFSALTDPVELNDYRMAWPRDKSFPVVPLSGDLAPFVIKSGGVIAFTTLPLVSGKIQVVHYLRLTRADHKTEVDSAE